MAKRKTYKKVKRKKKSGSSGVFIFLFAVIVLAVILFLSMESDSDEEKSAEQKIKEKIIVKDKEKSDDVENTEAQKNEVEEIKVESVLQAIMNAGTQLGVPPERFSTSVKKDGIHIYVPINGNRMDLVFANMIITGQVEMIGGKLLDGHKREYSGKPKHTVKFRGKDGKIYFVEIYYENNNKLPDEKPKISVIIDDFGEYAGKRLDEFCDKTDKKVTFAIIPYLKHSKDVMNAAHKSGHEIIIHAPMEPESYPRNDPGKYGIYVNDSPEKIKKTIDSYVEELPLAVGMNNHMGSMATSNRKTMDAVMKALKPHNLFFLDSRTISSSVAYATAKKYKIDTIQRDLFLDDPAPSKKVIEQRLEDLKKLKKKKNKVCAITHCFDLKHLEQLNYFIKKAEEMGFELVPLSEMFNNELPEIL
ncbi:MAG: hypothetical protein CSB55_00765 [Candidatus Cloacimonadota bacterium]|nr:MAG: hypothetical protein CSB55_00765 [Candidatus Cloacimonadota bacterium]